MFTKRVILPTSQTEAVLGEGYNFKEERFAGECVMGTPVYAGVAG